MCKPQGQKPVTNWTWVYDMRMLIGVGYPLVLRLFFQVDRQGLLSLLCKHKGQVRMMPIKDILPMLIHSWAVWILAAAVNFFPRELAEKM